ncbi:hypothetical protein HOG98_09280 [bacterium]|nr:hypothetical protein [bacterium]
MLFLPKKYEVSTTFFPETDSIQNPSNQILGYAEIFGINTPSNLSKYILIILKSKRLKNGIANELKINFKTEINSAIKKGTIKNNTKDIQTHTIYLLKLEKHLKIKLDENSLFNLNYVNNDPEMSLKVIHSALKNLNDINNKLKLFGNKKLITLLDEPEKPKVNKPVFPNPKIIFILSEFLTLMAFFTINLYSYYKKIYIKSK